MSVEPLTDLAALINEEHALTYYSIIDALEHAIACGEALIAAKATVPEGKWTQWVSDNLELESGAVSRYVRIATYKDHLLAAEDRPQSINAAITYLKAIEAPRIVTPAGSKPTFDVDEAKRLRDQGLSFQVIGDMLNVSDVAVQRQLHPNVARQARKVTAKSIRRKNAEARLAEQVRVDVAVTASGHPLAEAYGLLRDCEKVFDQVIAETDTDTGLELRKGLLAVYRAEDVILRHLDIKRKKRYFGREA